VQHERTLGYVAARIMECGFILVGIIAVLAVVTLRLDAGADAAALGVYAGSLAAIKDWTFKLGPGFVVGDARRGSASGRRSRHGHVVRSRSMR
jgi:hypothetical protein